MRNTGPNYYNSDRRWLLVCQNCYLSECYQDYLLLRRYCPIEAARRHRVTADKILEITQSVGTNRRWQFIELVTNVASLQATA